MKAVLSSANTYKITALMGDCSLRYLTFLSVYYDEITKRVRLLTSKLSNEIRGIYNEHFKKKVRVVKEVTQLK